MSNENLERTLELVAEPELRQPLGERQGTLTVLVGGDVGAVFEIGRAAVLIGRSPDAHITLDDDGASRRHARIVQTASDYEIEDLGSTNGTLINNARISGRMQLVNGVRVQIGNTLLRFSLQDKIEQEASRRVYEMSVRDGLTGVYNRRYFDERMASEFAFAARHRTALCVLLVDIDHFKRVNDGFGHPAGDAVLRAIAGELREGCRTEDVVARYGGEEFAVIARSIDVPGTRLFAERVRLMVENAHIQWENANLRVTASVGLAHNQAGSFGKAEALVAAADVALYAAKHAGRNRVEVAASPGRYSSGQAEILERPRKRVWEQVTAPKDDAQDAAVLNALRERLSAERKA